MGRKLVTRRQYRRLSQRASLSCLHGATDFALVVSNRYDHIDRRVQKITPAATHTFFYDGWLLIKEIVATTNGTTDVIEYHWSENDMVEEGLSTGKEKGQLMPIATLGPKISLAELTERKGIR